MGNEQSTEQSSPRIPKFEFRVLVVGRANAGKTSILQRVCETTESPTICRDGEVVTLDPSVNRGEHKIDDELLFSNHLGYVFHDSMGIESGSTEELEILKEYCVPMDNHRPELDLKFYDKICPDPNVPVIAVFTKYDQFLRNVKMDVSDYPDKYPDSNGNEVAEKLFQDHYVRPLGNNAKYVRLEKMHMKDSRCDNLVEETAAALNEDTVVLMLLAVQRGNIELSVKSALSRLNLKKNMNILLNMIFIILENIIIIIENLNKVYQAKVSLLYKTKQVKSLPAIQNVLFLIC
ncbi:hypothetical protein EI94DRAFT_1730201 [Lactarius quietus]|nr:hypothetical protein EI94DRAFT_1730201 [Lactarius quietus]